jgi:hypothetical protein
LSLIEILVFVVFVYRFYGEQGSFSHTHLVLKGNFILTSRKKISIPFADIIEIKSTKRKNLYCIKYSTNGAIKEAKIETDLSVFRELLIEVNKINPAVSIEGPLLNISNLPA